jgi:hypothetical protein
MHIFNNYVDIKEMDVHPEINNFNPVSNHGLLGLGYILNIYILYYIWNDL